MKIAERAAIIVDDNLSFGLEKIKPANPGDTRGPIFEWKFSDGRQITISERYRGENFGGHYHGGDDPSKNPERIFIAKGKVRLQYAKLGDKDRTEYIVEQGDSIIIRPEVSHWAEALEDTILIEYRTTHFDKAHPDTYPV